MWCGMKSHRIHLSVDEKRAPQSSTQKHNVLFRLEEIFCLVDNVRANLFWVSNWYKILNLVTSPDSSDKSESSPSPSGEGNPSFARMG